MVNEKGDAWKKSSYEKDEWVKTAVTKDTKGYRVITCSVDNKQHRMYLHRAIAEAFLPNPNGYAMVLFKNKNIDDVYLGNLKWGTAKELHIKEKVYGCSRCGSKEELSEDPSFICPVCRYKEKQAEKKFKRMQEQKLKAKQMLRDVDASLLRKRHREVYELKKEGLTNEEIGNKMGISRQRVGQIMKKVVACKKRRSNGDG